MLSIAMVSIEGIAMGNTFVWSFNCILQLLYYVYTVI